MVYPGSHADDHDDGGFSNSLLDDRDYILQEGAAWFEIAGKSIRIQDDNGTIIITVYKLNEEMEDSLGSLIIPPE